MKNTMKAQVMHEWNGPFHLEDRPIPKVGPTEALIEVKACGIVQIDSSSPIAGDKDCIDCPGYGICKVIPVEDIISIIGCLKILARISKVI